MTDTKATWRERVESWRTSGETAAAFSTRHGFASSTLRWWASQLKREDPSPTPVSLVRPSTIRLARVVRSPYSGEADSERRSAIAIELPTLGARVMVAAGVDRSTLELVLTTLGVGARR